MSVDTGKPANIPSYEVVGDWADLSGVAGATSCWVHNAIVATDGGEIIGFHAGQLVAFDPDGRLLRVVETGLTEGHGITRPRRRSRIPLGQRSRIRLQLRCRRR